jgi:MFS family permease
MSRTFNTGRGEVAWVGSMWTGFMILLTVPAGMLPDYIGLKAVAFIGALLLGVGLATSAEARDLWVLYVLAVVVGMGE